MQNGPKIDLASLVIGAATIGILGVTRTLSHLWLLLTLLLFRKMKLVWHGLLTADENRYIEKRANMEASGKLLQDFIDEMESPESALIAASADGYLTILPPGTKMNVWIDMGDNGVIDTTVIAKETELMHMLSEADGFLLAKVTIYHKAAAIYIELNYH